MPEPTPMSIDELAGLYADQLPELESVRILRLQPGDTLVVRVDQHLTSGQAQDVKDHMSGLFPGHQVLVVGQGVDVEVVRDGDDA